MTKGKAREAARALLEIMPLVMRTVAAELRAAGELPAPAHFPLLHILSEHPRTLSELAALRGVSLPSMSNSVTTLVDRGWVRRVTPGADRRVVMLEVTPGGRAALDRVAKAAEVHLADVLVAARRTRPPAASGGPGRHAAGVRRRRHSSRQAASGSPGRAVEFISCGGNTWAG